MSGERSECENNATKSSLELWFDPQHELAVQEMMLN
jgi:hypothetical protein